MIIGRKQLEQLGALTSSFVFYGIGWCVFGAYLTDWKVVTKIIPYYNGKYRGIVEKPDDKSC